MTSLLIPCGTYFVNKVAHLLVNVVVQLADHRFDEVCCCSLCTYDEWVISTVLERWQILYNSPLAGNKMFVTVFSKSNGFGFNNSRAVATKVPTNRPTLTTIWTFWFCIIWDWGKAPQSLRKTKTMLHFIFIWCSYVLQSTWQAIDICGFLMTFPCARFQQYSCAWRLHTWYQYRRGIVTNSTA